MTTLTPPNRTHPNDGKLNLTAFSAVMDEGIRVWDLSLQTCVSTWRVPCPYKDMKIKGLQGLSETQLMTLIVLGAVELMFGMKTPSKHIS
jgi:hypothetical protein